jgi:opacity protein-like surface antigen
MLLASLQPALAGQMYGLFSIGSSRTSDLGNGITESGMSNGLMIGYQVNQNLAFEAGYNGLYNAATLSGTNGLANISMSGVELATLGMWPCNDQISVFFRFGYGAYASNSSWSGINSGVQFTAANTDSPTGFIYGLGMKYTISKDFDARLGYNIYNLTGQGSNSIIANNVSTVSFVNGDALIHSIYIAGVTRF